MPTPTINLERVRQWLSVSELRLVESARRPALGMLGPAELKRKMAQARKLRDKWRDVYSRQRREVQQVRGSRATAANSRSREKTELFAAVLSRFEAQLEKTAVSSSSATARKGSAPAKTTRARGHRKARAQSKRQLAAHTAERQSDTIRSAQADSPPMQTRRPAPKAERPRRKSAARAPRQSKPPDKKARHQSRTAASRHRIAVSGLTTRIHGHVSARGKRTQARRDRRG
jgi:hypothetical protein